MHVCMQQGKYFRQSCRDWTIWIRYITRPHCNSDMIMKKVLLVIVILEMGEIYCISMLIVNKSKQCLATCIQ